VNIPVAIIGDVHGNVRALEGILNAIGKRDQYARIVLVGDYVDRGSDSAAVIQLLVDQVTAGRELYCIAGNHDIAFVDCLEKGSLATFLKIGGAATIQSYLSDIEPDILEQLRREVPANHRAFLRDLRPYYADDSLIVTHTRDDLKTTDRSRFHVFGHVPQVGHVPTITSTWAAIDTVCAIILDGRLPCLFWPALDYIQVGAVRRSI